ncbi:hypothetical protein BDZ45DRAFT_32155 [Acephala macrosclerotiorum]|nr:hypothetical protein BDZ45DRAFT_32155 [Acephala macrosclerotiorum]
MAPSPKRKGKESDSNEPQPQPSNQQFSSISSPASQTKTPYNGKPTGPPCCPWPFTFPFQRQYSTIPLKLRLPPGRTQPPQFEEDLGKAFELLVPVQRQAFERATEVPGLVHPLEGGSGGTTDLSTAFKDILKVSTRDLARLVGKILARKRSMEAKAIATEPSQANAQAQDGSSQRQPQTSASGAATGAPVPSPNQLVPIGAGRPAGVVYGTSHQLEMLNSSCPLASPAQLDQSNLQNGYGQAQQSSDFPMNNGQMDMTFQPGFGSVQQSSDLSMNNSQMGILGAETGVSYTLMLGDLDPALQPQDGSSHQSPKLLENNCQWDTIIAGASPHLTFQGVDPMPQFPTGSFQQPPQFSENMQSGMMGAEPGQILTHQISAPMPQMPLRQFQQSQYSSALNLQPNMMGVGGGNFSMHQYQYHSQLPQILPARQGPSPELAPGEIIPIFENGRAHLHLSGSRALSGRPVPQHITHILDVTQEQLDKKQLKPFKEKDRYRQAPLSEDAPADEDGLFRPLHIDFILTMGRKVLREGGHLLVHDTTGISRAPAAIMIILMDVFGMNLDDAYNQVMKRRNGRVQMKDHVLMNVKRRWQMLVQNMGNSLPNQQLHQQQSSLPLPPAYQAPVRPHGQQFGASNASYQPIWMPGTLAAQLKQQEACPQEKASDVLQLGKPSPLPVQLIADINITAYGAHIPQQPNNSYESPYIPRPSASEPASIQQTTPPFQPEASADPSIDPLLQNQLCASVDLAIAALEQGAGKLPTPPKSEKNSKGTPSPGTESSSGQSGQSADLSLGQIAGTSSADADSVRDPPQQAEQGPRGQADTPQQSQATQRPGQEQNHPIPPDYKLVNFFNEVVTTHEFRQLSVYISCSAQDVAPAKQGTYVLDLDPENSPYTEFPRRLELDGGLDMGKFEKLTNQCIESSGVLLIYSSRDDTCLRIAAGAAFFVLCKFGKWAPQRAIDQLKSCFMPPSPGDIKAIWQRVRPRVPAPVLQRAQGENIPQLQGQSAAGVRPQLGLSAAPDSSRKRTLTSLPDGSGPSPAKRQNLEGNLTNNSINVLGNSGQDFQTQSPPKYGFPEHAIREQDSRSKKHQDPKPGTKGSIKSDSLPSSDGQEEQEKRKRGRPKGSRNKMKPEQDAAGSPKSSTGRNEPGAGQEPTTSLAPGQRKGEPSSQEKTAAVEPIIRSAEANNLTAYLIPLFAQRSANAQSQGIPQPIIEASEQAAIQAVNNEVNPPPPSRSRLFEGIGPQPQISYDDDLEFANLPPAIQRARILGRPDPYGQLAFQAIILDGEHAQRGLIAEHQQRGNDKPLFANPINAYGPRLDEAYVVMNTLPPQPQPVPAVPNPPQQHNAVRNLSAISHAPGPSRAMNPSPSGSEQSASPSPPRRPALHAEVNRTNPFAPAASGSMARFVQQAFDGQPLLPPVEDAETFRNNFPREEYQMTPYSPAPWEMEHDHDEEC